MIFVQREPRAPQVAGSSHSTSEFIVRTTKRKGLLGVLTRPHGLIVGRTSPPEVTCVRGSNVLRNSWVCLASDNAELQPRFAKDF